MLTRRYRLEDIPRIIELVRGFVEQAPAYAHVPFEAPVLERALKVNISNNQFFCNVVIVDEELVGGMSARLFSYAFSSTLFAQDVFLFVKDEYRSYDVVSKLNQDYIAWAKERNAHVAKFSFSHGIMGAFAPAFSRLAERLGYKPVGYIWEIDT